MTNLMLSRHGIWYYRKVTVTPRGKRKEIRKSLRTRNKQEAKLKVLALQNCFISKRTEPINEPEIIDYWKQLDSYLKTKEGLAAERQIMTINSQITKYLDYTPDVLSKKAAADFIESLSISDNTKNKYMVTIGGFFRWLSARHDTEINNPFKNLMIKRKGSIRELRVAYTKQQASQLLALSKEQTNSKTLIIQIALFTGMRANEIVQLSSDNIVNIEGLWCISINDEKAFQVVKNFSSKRVIPIHYSLSNLIAYADSVPTGERLFPEFKEYKGNCAHYFCKWFNSWRKGYDLPEFHSIRHYVATALKINGIELQYAQQILGHSSRSITYNRYGKQIPPKPLVPAIESLDLQ